jgi:hypothetical protein
MRGRSGWRKGRSQWPTAGCTTAPSRDVLLIEPNAKEYGERGRFEQPGRSRIIANGKLYIRDQDVLFCYDVKAK